MSFPDLTIDAWLDIAANHREEARRARASAELNERGERDALSAALKLIRTWEEADPHLAFGTVIVTTNGTAYRYEMARREGPLGRVEPEAFRFVGFMMTADAAAARIRDAAELAEADAAQAARDDMARRVEAASRVAGPAVDVADRLERHALAERVDESDAEANARHRRLHGLT